ncbi:MULTISPECIES: hypothetical protein [unclassified Anabaena]|uniref:hypothetical protein n=1 Tax=unclassified Anabaena TaxID=2619674 RepID=UPI0039C61D33
MKKSFLPVAKFSLATLAGIGFASLLIIPPSLAQLNQVDRGTNQNSDQFAGPNSGDLDIFQMIHQANFGNINWNREQQQEQLNSEAAKFKAAQERAIQKRQQELNTNQPSSSPEDSQLP